MTGAITGNFWNCSFNGSIDEARPIPNQSTDCYEASIYPVKTLRVNGASPVKTLRVNGASNRALTADEVLQLYNLGARARRLSNSV